jgi:hypothetical protein
MNREEKIKKVATLRSTLEKRVETIKTELEELQALLDLVNSVLLDEGFKRATEKPRLAKTPPPSVSEVTSFDLTKDDEKPTSLTTPTGELLANLFFRNGSLRIVLAKDKDFDINTPPFNSFLLERVIKGMWNKDQKNVDRGELIPDKMFSYDLVLEEDLIQEIHFKNITSERFRELKSAIRWTLEKMWQKMVK